ncbi:MAG: DUF192 domain-containing protein [Bryobacter sp.]|nr:DUF192 domain-containing protein [Bryobacter sp.]
MAVRNVTRATVVASEAGIADTSRTRRTGLLKHDRLEPGEGLWIVPTEAIHTFGMRFNIDVVFLNKRRQVVKLREDMPRRRMSVCWRAHSVLELPPGTIRATQTAVGDQLEFVKTEVVSAP